VRAVVVVTSDKCYADASTRARSELTRWGATDPYRASEAAAELVVAALRNTHAPD